MIETVIILMRVVQVVSLTLGVFLILFILLLCFYLIRGHVPWVPTNDGQARALLRLAGLRKGERVLDLGCGDGRILIVAAHDFEADGIGYDINLALLFVARLRAFKAGVSRRIQLRRGDLFRIPIPKADVVALYLYERVNEQLLPRLREALPRGTRVVTRVFPIPSLTPKVTQTYEHEMQYLYEL
ncbi:TPA: SAM-dependent methyltransferase [Candidatus Uhrbacteria bacterium]|nr:SAM-dependent methyltransferase [Candidatus Uhrbacteria bacterium]